MAEFRLILLFVTLFRRKTALKGLRCIRLFFTYWPTYFFTSGVVLHGPGRPSCRTLVTGMCAAHAARSRARSRAWSRLSEWHQGLPVPSVYAFLNRWAGMVRFISGGIMFHLLDALTLKKFFLMSSLPFFTFTFRLSVATLVSLSPSHAFSNHVP